MRRRSVLLVAAASMALAVSGGVQPAAAHTDACAGTGLASVGTPHGYFALGSPSVTTSFAVNIVFGTCVQPSSFWATGEITGWCETTTGSGVTSTGHNFTMVGSGYKFVVAGEATGIMEFHSESLDLPCEPEIGTTYRAVTSVVLTHPV